MTVVLSDLDGVLVDSQASIMRAWHWWGERHGVSPAAIDALPHGRPSSEVIPSLAPGLDVAAESAALDRRQAEDVGDVVALPGAAEVLRAFGPDRIAVVTSCTGDLARARLAAAGLAGPGRARHRRPPEPRQTRPRGLPARRTRARRRPGRLRRDRGRARGRRGRARGGDVGRGPAHHLRARGSLRRRTSASPTWRPGSGAQAGRLTRGRAPRSRRSRSAPRPVPARRIALQGYRLGDRRAIQRVPSIRPSPYRRRHEDRPPAPPDVRQRRLDDGACSSRWAVGAYAAATLPKNSVGTTQLRKAAVTRAKIKNNAVDGSKVADRSITGADVKESTLTIVPSATHALGAAAIDKVTYKAVPLGRARVHPERPGQAPCDTASTYRRRRQGHDPAKPSSTTLPGRRGNAWTVRVGTPAGRRSVHRRRDLPTVTAAGRPLSSAAARRGRRPPAARAPRRAR